MNLSESDPGLVLFCFALGAIVAMTNTGRLIPRFGTANLCVALAGLYGITLIPVPLAPGFIVLSALVGLSGASFGALDVTMNTDAVLLEHNSGRHIMSPFHAVFSIGTFVGAAICAPLLSAGAGVATCRAINGAGVMLLAAAARSCSHPPSSPEQKPGRVAAGTQPMMSRSARRRLLLLGALAFLGLFAEGAIMDWTAIYLVSVLGTSASTAAFGFALFAVSIAIGRLIGDAATRALGPA